MSFRSRRMGSSVHSSKVGSSQVGTRIYPALLSQSERSRTGFTTVLALQRRGPMPSRDATFTKAISSYTVYGSIRIALYRRLSVRTVMLEETRSLAQIFGTWIARLARNGWYQGSPNNSEFSSARKLSMF